MKIFLAGATGVIGRRLVPAMASAGYEVVGTSRTIEGAARVQALGGEGIVLDALDRSAVIDAVARISPEVVMHQLTDIRSVDLKDFDGSFASTNRLRTDALDHLLNAARSSGAKRFVAQSFTGWTNERIGAVPKTETDPLDRDPAKQARMSLQAINHLETRILEADDIEAIALRYGHLYGPETAYAPGGEMYEAISRRKIPVVGGGKGVWSFLHVEDAVSATVAALTDGESGLFNIVDDHPVSVSEWLPIMARSIGAKTPRRVPAFLAKAAIGEQGIRFMTDIRGSSNAKAKRILGWEPAHPSWRDGFGVGS